MVNFPTVFQVFLDVYHWYETPAAGQTIYAGKEGTQRKPQEEDGIALLQVSTTKTKFKKIIFINP